MTRGSRVRRLAERVDALPPTIRPAVYGALFIVVFALMRGAWIMVPIVLVYLFATSAHPWLDIATGVEVIGLAMAGGALSGLAYGLVGRHLRTAVRGGRYLTGIITIAPYTFLLAYIVRVTDGVPLWHPPTETELIIAGAMTLFFGSVIGHSWFGPDQSPDASGEPSA